MGDTMKDLEWSIDMINLDQERENKHGGNIGGSMNTVFLDKNGNARKPETWAEVKEAICKMWDSCEPCTYRGGHSRTEGGFECHHPLKEIPTAPCGDCPTQKCDDCRYAPYKIAPGDNCQPVNPVIVQLKRELAEAYDNELTAQGLGHNTDRWIGYQNAIRRAIQIVEEAR